MFQFLQFFVEFQVEFSLQKLGDGFVIRNARDFMGRVAVTDVRDRVRVYHIFAATGAILVRLDDWIFGRLFPLRLQDGQLFGEIEVFDDLLLRFISIKNHKR